jgi:hypothetical protein
MREFPFFSGNLDRGPDVDMRERALLHPPKRLVEECIALSTGDLKRLFGRKALLKAAEDARPVGVKLGRQSFSIYLVTEPHRLPGRRASLSDSDLLRLWLSCFGCRRKVRKLFTYPIFPGSSRLYELLCRRCHDLAYLSENSGNRKWYRNIVKPLRRLEKERERLMRRVQSPRNLERLKELDQMAWILHQRAKPKSRPRKRPLEASDPQPRKRRYRDINLVERSLQ